MKRKCDHCDRPATVHLTEIAHGKKIEKHLCEACAAKEGVPIQPPISQLLEDFVAQAQQAQQAQTRQFGELACPHCGISFLEFRQSGLLGCAYDYEVFQEPLTPLLQRAQEGGSQHVGKLPRRAGGDQQRQNELLQLRAALKEAVLQEQYERAAQLRDRIKELEHA